MKTHGMLGLAQTALSYVNSMRHVDEYVSYKKIC